MAPPQHDPQVAVSIDRYDFKFGTIYSGELLRFGMMVASVNDACEAADYTNGAIIWKKLSSFASYRSSSIVARRPFASRRNSELPEWGPSKLKPRTVRRPTGSMTPLFNDGPEGGSRANIR